MPKRFSEKQEREIVDAYRAWNETAENVEDLVTRLGVSKQSLYSILGRRGIPLKSRMNHSSSAEMISNELLDKMAEKALRLLLEEQVHHQNRIARLEAKLREIGVEPDTL